MMGLGQKARAAVVWNAGFNIFRDLVQFVVMLVLVRALAPTAYGEFGFVTSIIGFISVFAFNNFIGYTLQVKNDE
jgi:O-antigen/teichoic acid export membrane protein